MGDRGSDTSVGHPVNTDTGYGTTKPNSDNQSDKIVPERETEEKSQESNETESKDEKPNRFSSIVAAHYNSLDESVEERNMSKIIYLRNFNNWIKSMLIKEAKKLLPNEYAALKVLDMCCGKGGDLMKWLKTQVSHLICTDIAKTSLEQCQERFNDMSRKLRKNRDVRFECIHADCTRDSIRNQFRDPSISLDIVSCQFSFHYCFESLPQAEKMLENASTCLKPGGLFIGTLPNSNEIVKRLKEAGTKKLENEIFRLEMLADEPYSLFGAKYHFYLLGVVNCPEFLVHFPTFVKLASKYGLRLLKRKRFDEYYMENKDDGRPLMKRMKALETWPPFDGQKRFGDDEYEHAGRLRVGKDGQGGSDEWRLGTLSKSEWETTTLYQTFIFIKEKT